MVQQTRCQTVRGRHVGKIKEIYPITAKRHSWAACSLLTAVVSVGTDHRPFWCLLTDAPFGLIAVYNITPSSDFSTEESDLFRYPPRQPIRSRCARVTARDTAGVGCGGGAVWAQKVLTLDWRLLWQKHTDKIKHPFYVCEHSHHMSRILEMIYI